MIRIIFRAFLLITFLPLRATAVDTSSGYVTNAPTVTNWNTGWSTSGTTGWDYIGEVNGASGVYLGNDWVLTAGHVGTGTFTLDGVNYEAVAGSDRSIANGTADLDLFRISTAPALNPLILSTSAPVAFSQTKAGSQLVMIGYGGGQGETWGADTVNYINQKVTPSGYTYVSNDILTVYGNYSSGTASGTNPATVVGGDSGGGDFIYNSKTGNWELAGINEVVGTATINGQSVPVSGFVQMNTYESQIQGFSVVPEPRDSVLVFLVMAALVAGAKRFSDRRNVSKN